MCSLIATAIFVGGVSLLHLRPKFSVTWTIYILVRELNLRKQVCASKPLHRFRLLYHKKVASAICNTHKKGFAMSDHVEALEWRKRDWKFTTLTWLGYISKKLPLFLRLISLEKSRQCIYFFVKNLLFLKDSYTLTQLKLLNSNDIYFQVGYMQLK